MIDSIRGSKVLIQSSYHPFPHLETELEIIEQLLSQNNKVVYLKCDSTFLSCFANPNNRILTCLNCVSRVNNGLEQIGNHKNFEVIDYSYIPSLSLSNYQFTFRGLGISELKELKYKNYDLGLAAFSSLVSYTRDHEPDLELHRNTVDNLLRTGMYLFDFFECLLVNNVFNYTVLFNGRFNENRPLLRVCQNLNINYITHERSGSLNKYLVRFNDIPHSIEAGASEIEQLWGNGGDEKILIGEQFFKKRKGKIEESWYSFTKYQKVGLLPDEFDEKLINISIFNSSLDEYEGLEGFGSKIYSNDNIAILQICKSLLNFPRIRFYLRVHPNLSNLNNSQVKFIYSELSKCSNLTIIDANANIDSYELMIKSNMVITFASTIGIEAVYHNKLVFLLGRSPYENLEGITCPKSHIELIDKIIEYSNKDSLVGPNDSLKYGYWQEMMGYEFINCKPVNISMGYYNGVRIKSKFYLRVIEKIYNRILRILNL